MKPQEQTPKGQQKPKGISEEVFSPDSTRQVNIRAIMSSGQLHNHSPPPCFVRYPESENYLETSPTLVVFPKSKQKGATSTRPSDLLPSQPIKRRVYSPRPFCQRGLLSGTILLLRDPMEKKRRWSSSSLKKRLEMTLLNHFVLFCFLTHPGTF